MGSEGGLMRRLRRWARRFEVLDYRAAGRAAQSDWRLGVADWLSVWTHASDEIELAARDTGQGAMKYFAGVTGLRLRLKQRVRVLIFEDQAGFAAYTHPVTPDQVGSNAYCTPRGIVMCRQRSDGLMADFARTLAAQMVRYLTRWCLGAAASCWLIEGLAFVLAGKFGTGLNAPSAGLRAFRAVCAREELMPGHALMGVSYPLLARRAARWDDFESVAFCNAFYRQSSALAGYLLGSHQGAFKTFLAEAAGAAEPQRLFADVIGLTPDEAMDRTVADLLARPVPDYVAPQPLLRQRFAESVVRRIRNAENPAAKRRAAVRLIATAGYPWQLAAVEIGTSHESSAAPDWSSLVP